jgi:hypothetical protein
LFRRPWTIEAVSDAGDRHRWRVVGWFGSREFVANVANALAHGNAFPRVEAMGGAADGATSAPP